MSDDFDILDWIESGTTARRSVVIYNDPGVAAEYDELARRLEVAQRASVDPEASMDEGDEVTRILERMNVLYDRWQASKATWTVQALAPETIADIDAAHPVPVKGDDEVAWARTAGDALRDRELAYLSAAVVKVETAKGAATSVPVEALRKLRAKPGGVTTINRLITALAEANRGEVELPSPKSLNGSRGDQD